MHDIVLVVSDLGAGGAQRVLVTLANALFKRGKRILVLTLAGPAEDFFRLEEGIDRIALNSLGDSGNVIRALWSNASRIAKIRKEVRRSGAPKVLSFVGATNILTVLATLGLDVTTVISERNDPRRQSFGRIWDWLRRRVYPLADTVTANSHGAVEGLREYVPSAKLRHVPNPIEIVDGSTLPYNSGSRRILSIGRLTGQKAHAILIRAFASFVGEYPEWRLDIVGDGALADDLHQLVDRCGLRGKALIHKPTETPEDFYAAAEIFVLSSMFEGTPNVLLEAMNHRICTVVSDACGGALEFVDHDVTGLVTRAGDIDDLAAALSKLASNRELREGLASAGRERVKQNDAALVVDQWEEMLFASTIETQSDAAGRPAENED